MLCGMRRFVVVTCTCWLALCNAEVSNTYPLAFGMTPDEAAAAIGSPLIPLVQRRGDEIYVVDRYANIPGFYGTGHHVYLQFRKGALTGWKNDFRLLPHFPF